MKQKIICVKIGIEIFYFQNSIKMDCLRNSLIENILQKKCKKHSTMACDRININPLASEHRVCIFCIEEQKIPAEYILLMKMILNLDPSAKFPIFPNNGMFINFLDSNFDLENMLEKVDQFFIELKEKILKSINRMHDSENQRIQSIMIKFKKSKEQLESILSIKEIQGILLSQDINSSNDLHNFLLFRHSSTQLEQKIEKIKADYCEIDYTVNQYNFKQPIQKQEDILLLIDSLNFFIGKKNKMIFPSLHEQLKWQFSSIQCLHSLKASDCLSDLIIVNRDYNNTYEIVSKRVGWKQCYFSQPLENHKKYIIKLEIEKKEQAFSDLLFGLLKSQDKNDKHMKQSTGIYYNESSRGNTTKIVKGKNENILGPFCQKYLEIRIDVQNKIWRVSSFPQYDNIYSLDDPQRYDSKEKYYFAINNSSEGSRITVLGIKEVPYFDNKM